MNLPFTTNLAAGFLDSGALNLMIDGGIFMWPILALMILGIAVIIERYRSLLMLDTDAAALQEKVIALLSEDKVEESLELCDAARGPDRRRRGWRVFWGGRHRHGPPRVSMETRRANDRRGIECYAHLAQYPERGCRHL